MKCTAITGSNYINVMSDFKEYDRKKEKYTPGISYQPGHVYIYISQK